MTEDFSNYPKSITEIKGDKTGDASDWTPRDAIIDVLREIDRDKLTVDCAVICYRVRKPDGHTSTRFRNASPDIHTAFGILKLTENLIWDSAYNDDE